MIITKSILLNFLTSKGKKFTSEKLFNKSLRELQKVVSKNSKLILKVSIRNVSPVLDVTRVKRRKVLTSVPFFLKKSKRLSKSIKLIVKSSDVNNGNFSLNFSKEILDSSKNKGLVISKVKDLHQSSFNNKNFSHFRWF